MRDEAGFTLIEVVVALAIAGLGLSLLVAATGSGLESTTAADNTVQAIAHAQSHLAEVGRSLPLRRANYSGEEGGFRWRVHIADPVATAASGKFAIYPVTVTENWLAGTTPKSFSLYSERLGAP
jgi:general secretion pathway protein I